MFPKNFSNEIVEWKMTQVVKLSSGQDYHYMMQSYRDHV